MPFLYPSLLGLSALAAVPILIHLLNKQRYVRIHWAAMQFLADALREQHRKIKYKELLLMLLRTLACLLLVAAIARPVTRFLTGAGTVGQGRGVVMVIDTSASMSILNGPEALFDQAKRQAADFVRRLPVGSQVAVLEGCAPPRVVVAGTRDLPVVESRIRELEINHRNTDVQGALRRAAELLDAMTDVAGRDVVFVSDLQASVWSRDPGATRELARQLGPGTTCFVLPIRQDDTSNVAVAGLHTDSAFVNPGVPCAIKVEIANTGMTPVADVLLDLFVGDDRVATKSLSRIQAGETISSTFLVEMDTPGDQVVRAVVDGARGRFAVDDTRWVVLHVVREIRTLLVGNATGTRFGAGDTDFLAASIIPDASVANPFVIQASTATDWTSQDIRQSDLIVLSNLPFVGEGHVQALAERVAQGAGLMVFLGANVIPEEYNRWFRPSPEEPPVDEAGTDVTNVQPAAPEKEDLMPARVGSLLSRDPHVRERAGTEDSLIYLSQAHLEHEWMSFFRVPEYRRLLRAPLSDGYGLDATGARQTRVVAYYDTGQPAIVEKRLGRGRIVLIGTAATPEWNQFFQEYLGPILVQRMVTDLLPGGDLQRNLLAGETTSFPLLADERRATCRLVYPDKRVREVSPEYVGTRPVLAFDGDGPVGVYRYDIDARTSREEVFALNLNSMESDLRSLGRDEMAELFPGKEIRLLADRKPGQSTAALDPSLVGTELWWPMLLLALLVFITEIVLARRFTPETPGAGDVPGIVRATHRTGPAAATLVRGRQG